tara:strand:- start:5423 stop:5665 length:243 start_codon:yes stop_codon:yes gene_type:complete
MWNEVYEECKAGFKKLEAETNTAKTIQEIQKISDETWTLIWKVREITWNDKYSNKDQQKELAELVERIWEGFEKFKKGTI